MHTACHALYAKMPDGKKSYILCNRKHGRRRQSAEGRFIFIKYCCDEIVYAHEAESMEVSRCALLSRSLCKCHRLCTLCTAYMAEYLLIHAKSGWKLNLFDKFMSVETTTWADTRQCCGKCIKYFVEKQIEWRVFGIYSQQKMGNCRSIYTPFVIHALIRLYSMFMK